MPVYYPYVPPAAVAPPAAPSAAPTISGQAANATWAAATTPTGGISAGQGATVNKRWRCRFHNAAALSAPGPSTADLGVTVGSAYVTLTGIPVSADATVDGVLIERSNDGGATWHAYTQGYGYTVPNGGAMYRDLWPDAELT